MAGIGDCASGTQMSIFSAIFYSIVDLDAELANSALDLRMAGQELNRPKVSGSPIVQHRIRAPQRMHPEFRRIEPDTGLSLMQKSCTLSRGQSVLTFTSTGKQCSPSGPAGRSSQSLALTLQVSMKASSRNQHFDQAISRLKKPGPRRAFLRWEESAYYPPRAWLARSCRIKVQGGPRRPHIGPFNHVRRYPLEGSDFGFHRRTD